MFNKLEPLQLNEGCLKAAGATPQSRRRQWRQRQHPPVALSVPAALLRVTNNRLPGCNERV
jgi:hypothetical protein